jgi:hypothetical protein
MVDLKPSLGPVNDETGLKLAQLDIPSVMSYEQPRFLLALREHAEYIAMMDPLTGLVLAALLENTAAAMEAAFDPYDISDECVNCPAGVCTCPPDWYCTRCTGWAGENCHCWDDLTALARLILGES